MFEFLDKNTNAVLATKNQREYLVNTLCKERRIEYKELMELVSIVLNRKITDIGQVRWSSQMQKIILYVKRLEWKN